MCTSGCSQYEYTITRTWLATDACGNSSTCSQIITVGDTQGPVITCPANLTIECDEDTSPSNTGMATGSDNCSAESEIVITSSDVVHLVVLNMSIQLLELGWLSMPVEIVAPVHKL